MAVPSPQRTFVTIKKSLGMVAEACNHSTGKAGASPKVQGQPRQLYSHLSCFWGNIFGKSNLGKGGLFGSQCESIVYKDGDIKVARA